MRSLPAAFLALILFVGAAEAEPVRAGWSEPVHFPDLNITLNAKLDTGAKTSSLGGQDVREFQRNGQDWIGFAAANGQARIERPVVRRAKIRRAGAPDQRRPVVRLLTCFAGVTRLTEFTITDRSEMTYPLLLGRRFLAGRVVVDAGAIDLTGGDCGP
ncbi:MAG: ATP-dependent zinc protease [Pseudomonadota bacterium]